MPQRLRSSLNLCAALASLLLAGCGGKGGGHAADHPRADFKMVSAGRVEGGTNGGDPARVSLRWPEFNTAAGPGAKDSMSAWIRAAVLAPATEGDAGGDSTVVIEQFLEVYRTFKQQYPTATAAWYLERSADVLTDTLGVVTLDMRENSFGGGAHPNSMRRLASFDPAGHQLRVSDVIVEGKRDSLDGIAEVYFRMSRGLGPEDNLDQAGYQFPGRFRVNDNIGFTPAGLLVYFNPYEVASYAEGGMEFTVPWAALKGMVREDSPFAGLAK